MSLGPLGVWDGSTAVTQNTSLLCAACVQARLIPTLQCEHQVHVSVLRWRCLTVANCSWYCCLLLLQTPLTRESHSSGVSLKDFYQSPELNSFFSPLSLSLDKEGKVLTSSCTASGC